MCYVNIWFSNRDVACWLKVKQILDLCKFFCLTLFPSYLKKKKVKGKYFLI